MSLLRKEGPDSQGTPTDHNPPALKKLLAKVIAISPDKVTRYEMFLRDPTGLNFLLYVATLDDTRVEVQDAINLGLEKPAVSALVKLIQEKKSSTHKADLLICAQSIIAVDHFGSHAKEAATLLGELQNHKDKAVGTAAKLALEDINKPAHPASPEPTKTQPVLTGQAAKGSEQPAAGLLTFQVKSLKTQNSYEYSDYRGNASITAKAADTLLVVNVSVQNGGKAWETFSSSSFRIVRDKDGKPVEAEFPGLWE